MSKQLSSNQVCRKDRTFLEIATSSKSTKRFWLNLSSKTRTWPKPCKAPFRTPLSPRRWISINNLTSLSTNIVTSKSRKSYPYSEMISSHRKICGLKRRRSLRFSTDLISTLISTRKLLSNSINNKWFCNKNNSKSYKIRSVAWAAVREAVLDLQASKSIKMANTLPEEKEVLLEVPELSQVSSRLLLKWRGAEDLKLNKIIRKFQRIRIPPRTSSKMLMQPNNKSFRIWNKILSSNKATSNKIPKVMAQKTTCRYSRGMYRPMIKRRPAQWASKAARHLLLIKTTTSRTINLGQKMRQCLLLPLILPKPPRISSCHHHRSRFRHLLRPPTVAKSSLTLLPTSIFSNK